MKPIVSTIPMAATQPSLVILAKIGFRTKCEAYWSQLRIRFYNSRSLGTPFEPMKMSLSLEGVGARRCSDAAVSKRK